MWFDGEWPHSVEEWQARRLERMIRKLQPGVCDVISIGFMAVKKNTVYRLVPF